MRSRHKLSLIIPGLILALLMIVSTVSAESLAVTDPDSGISYVVPNGWKQVKRLGTTSAVTSSDDLAYMTVAFTKFNPNDLDSIKKEFVKASERNLRSFELISAEPVTIAEKKALRLVIEFELGYRFRQLHLKVPKAGGYVDIVFGSFKEDWSNFEAAFTAIQSSLKFQF
ncbi:MAG TPA: hypothetical protein DF292_07685 [Firmicutes bacterium]|jgi:hypothetical protein|nr:hypothetical protein [Bacillota bacterium]